MPAAVSSVGEWFEAIQAGQVELVRNHAAEYAKSVNSDGETGLMIAAREGNVELVKILGFFENGMVNSEGKTAIMIAAEANKGDVCKRLVAYEVNTTYGDFQMTPLMLAAEHGSTSAVSNLLPYLKAKTDTRGRTALMYAAAAGHTDVVKLLVVREKEIVSLDHKTAFVLAAENGHTDIVQCLASYEANLIPEFTRPSLMNFSSSQVGNPAFDLSLSFSLIDAHRFPSGQAGVESLTQTKTQLEHELESKIMQLELKLASLHDESSIVIGQNVSLHNQVKNMEENITTLRIEISRLQSETADKDAIINDLKERLSDMEGLVGAGGSTEDIDNLKCKIRELQNELAEKERDICALNERLTTVPSPTGDAAILADYENRINALKDELDARESDLSELRPIAEKTRAFEDELASLRTMLDERNARIAELEQATVSQDEAYATQILEEEIESLRQALLAKDGELDALQTRLEETAARGEPSDFDAIIEAKNSEIARLQDLIQRAESVQRSSADGDKRVAQLEAQIAGLEKLLSEAQGGDDERIKELNEQIADLQFELTNAKEDINERDDEIELLRDRIQEEMKNSAALQEKVDALEADTARGTDSAEYLARIEELQQQVRDLNDRLAEPREALHRLAEPREAPVDETAVRALEEKIEALNDEIEARDNQIAELKELLDSMPAQPADVDSGKLTALEEENDRLKGELQTLNDELDALKASSADEASSLRGQITHLNKEVSDLKESLANARASGDASDIDKLIELQEQLEDAREQLMSLQDKYDCATAEMEEMRKALEEAPVGSTVYTEEPDAPGSEELAKLKEEIDTLKEEIQVLNDELGSMHGQNREQKDEINRLNDALKEKEGLIADLRAQLDNTVPQDDARIKILENEIADLKNTVAARDGAIRELEEKTARLDELEKLAADRGKEITEKEHSLRRLEDEVRQLDDALRELRDRPLSAAPSDQSGAEYVDAQTEVSDVDYEEQAKISSVLDASDDLIQKINELQALVDDLTRDNDYYKNDREKILAEMDALREDLRNGNLKNDSLATDKERLMRQVRDLTDLTESLRRDLTEQPGQDELAALRQEACDLRSRVDELTDAAKGKDEAIDRLERELAVARASAENTERLSELLDEVESYKAKLDESKEMVKDLLAQLADKDAELADAARLRTVAGGSDEDTELAKARVASLENEVAELRAQLNGRLAEIDAVHKNLVDSDAEAARLREEAAALRAQLEVAQVPEDTERVRMLEDQLQGARKELAELRVALEAKEMEAEELRGKVATEDPELAGKLEATDATTQKLRENVDALQDELRALNDQLATKTAEAEKAAELGQLVKQLEEDLDKAKQLVSERDALIDELRQRVQGADEDDDLKEKIAELNDEIETLNNDLKDKDAEIAELREQLEAQPTATTVYPESGEEVGDVAALREVQDENAALKDELEAKQSLVDELQEEIESLKQQCDSLKDDMIKLDNANNDKLAALQCSLDESRKQIADLQEEVEVLKNTANDIDPAVVESLQEELRKLQEELDDRENTITELQGLLDEQEGSNADLGAKIDALTRELEEARDARPQSGNDERINALEAEITSLQELLDKANEDLAQKTDECGKAIGEAGNLRKAVEYYKKLVDDIRAGIVVLDDNLSALDLQ